MMTGILLQLSILSPFLTDCLNVRSTNENKAKLEAPSDERLEVSFQIMLNIMLHLLLQWLENDFLAYLQVWEDSVKGLQLMKGRR